MLSETLDKVRLEAPRELVGKPDLKRCGSSERGEKINRKHNSGHCRLRDGTIKPPAISPCLRPRRVPVVPNTRDGRRDKLVPWTTP